ncbi:hypothetical protein [Streptomyces sp. URMC 129]|uniref:hypothetical protein n=1 Tax=Streptomyces sp. URMC 129 TaxID=3423407 RepID=UPI003F1C6429
MNPGELAASAADILLAGAGRGVGEGVAELVRARLAATAGGQRALADLDERDPASANEVRDLIAQAIRSDSEFSAQLERAVNAVLKSQSAGRDINSISVNGTVRGSHFTIGPVTINNTRGARIAMAVGAVFAVLLLLLSGYGAVHLITGDEGESPAVQGAGDGRVPDAGSSGEDIPGSDPPADEPTASGDQLGDDTRPSGPATELTDDDGYRFEVVGRGAGTAPEISVDSDDRLSAPPGTVFAYVDMSVTNKQVDRSAMLNDALVNWYIHVPISVRLEDYTLSRCGDAVPDYCGDKVSCQRVDESSGELVDLGGFGEDERTIPAGATWELRCFLGQNNLGMVGGAQEVKDSLQPDQIRLFRIEYDGPFDESVAERTDIPLA